MPDATKIFAGGPLGYIIPLPLTTGQGYPDEGLESDAILEAADWTGKGWVGLPTLTNNCTVKFKETSEETWPLHTIFRTHDTLTEKGVDTITLEYSEANTSALKYALSGYKATTITAATARAAEAKLTDGGVAQALVFYQLAFQLRGPEGYDYIIHIKKARPVGDVTLSLGHKKIVVPAVFKCFALDTEAADAQVVEIHEYTGIPTA